MKALIQRVNHARVRVDNQVIGEIEKGMLLLLGIADGDTDLEIDWMVDKVANLRIFADDEGKMNLSLLDIQGELMVVSQFTLYGDCRKGRRPSFIGAGAPDLAIEVYKKFIQKAQSLGLKTAEGEFQSHMKIELENDGPVTFMIES